MNYDYLYIFVAIVVSIIVAVVLQERLETRTPTAKAYYWGFFFGCMGAACAPIALLMIWGALLAAMNSRWNAFETFLIFTVIFAIQAICGWFIIQRTRWAWVFGTILNFNIIMHSLPLLTPGMLVLNIIVWISNYIYGKNRWGEFVNKNYPKSSDEAFDLLANATKLEAQGRIQEAIFIYQSVVDKYSQSAAVNDAKISLKNLAALGHDISQKQ